MLTFQLFCNVTYKINARERHVSLLNFELLHLCLTSLNRRYNKEKETLALQDEKIT